MSSFFPPETRDMSQAVRAYMAHGWGVIPVRARDKRALIKWEEFQHRRPGEADWAEWLRTPELNVALVTGEISGVTVVDVDGAEGLASMRALGRELPKTLLQKSPHGWHLFFRYEPGLRNKTRLLPGVDIRGDGGYVLVSPSRLEDGEYTWARQVDLQPFPTWLAAGDPNGPGGKTLEPGARVPTTPPGAEQPKWVARALMEGAPSGERNGVATRLAGYFFGRGLPEDVVLAALEPYRRACRPEMDGGELAGVVRSVGRYRRFAVSAGINNPPTVQRTAAGERYLWDDVAAEIRGVTRSKTAILAEIGFTLSLPGLPESVRAPAVVNLLSQRERDALVQSLLRQVPEVPWSQRIDVLCRLAVEAFRKGEPAVLLKDALRPAGGDAYALKPLILADAPTVWFADGGTGKSLLALAAACAMAGHDVFGGLHATRPWRVLYLDWEWDDWQHAERLRQLLGEDMDVSDLLYRRCNGGLSDEIEAIRQIVADEEVEFVIIDSLGAACGGNLVDPDTAILFGKLMRSLGIGSLWITHTTKNGGDDEKPFGTVYFHNMARLSWRIKRQSEAGAREFEVGFYNHKSNSTGIQRPLGFRIDFGPEHTVITTTDLMANAELSRGLPLRERVLALLRTGPSTAGDMADALGTTKGTVQNKLTTLKQAGLIVDLGNGRWALAERRIEVAA